MMKDPVDLNTNQLEELISDIKQSNLPENKKKLILSIINSVSGLYKLVCEKQISIARLKRFFGIKSEKAGRVMKEKKESKRAADKPAGGKKKSKGHGKNGADKYPAAEKIFYPHESLKNKDRCPECRRGNLYQLEPGTVLRIVGSPTIMARVHQPEKLRCSGCGQVYTAKLPDDVGEERFDETANSMVALLKYGSGFPFYRLENLQEYLGIPLPDSTQWDMVQKAARAVDPVHRVLIKLAAQAGVIHVDDTTARILSLMDEEKGKEGRTGMFTSGVLAKEDGWEIALFFTGRNHAGENLNYLLSERRSTLPPPIRMADALSWNFPQDYRIILANCLVHGRRNFVDCYSAFPEECGFVIEQIGQVYTNEKTCKQQHLQPEERLAYHQKHSAPVMDEIEKYVRSKLKKKEVEPNSSLGKAFKYLLNHWKGLTCFLRVPGSPIDNNTVERLLKKSILHRKNSLFFKTEYGAQVGDILMSIIQTAVRCGQNPFDYLTALQKHSHHVSSNPESWLPWNFLDTLTSLELSRGT